MFDCTVDCFSLPDDLALKRKITDLEKLLNCASNKPVVDHETRAEIVHSVASRMGRVAYVRRLSMGRVRQKRG
ncbi:ssr2848 [Synechocystis sp. PCC 6803]|jgi:hypothetical protein|uniref:Ssr2848 protein n=1 Tax=Synechocystis sp. (strain ATCC 27184 / PCC 6803 / Kazusa) TaxID=1111708 RepID=P73206_SYNY3|nr:MULTISPECIES: hypothetical protein [unclassified Synechocystis]BAM50953.1 hypothetical protein BEST7613_2022 [Synechocystis sp. PCC 6803] [Bacillus subtilis BEST7613]AGF50923.1 hypothetical protein MYO_16650 [Synechocystis sp. PCC 6803]ALJ66970.1 hypothetical protein AOY38_03385 [Synechocystis sp. PCC 6803]AVP88813.1 hypothetical protein C7I86_03400 [Synechocystis sp. IPPAS B-1465]MBD2617325.1 hypothetical protein [Synechocystis sp. FACHB-898]